MLTEAVLIADNRKEISQKYKRIIQANSKVQVIVTNSMLEIFEYIDKFEPELVIISDNFEENVSEICIKIRAKSRLFRPIIVVLSKSSYKQDKIEALSAGADDFLSEPIDSEEFFLRISAHLRRRVEELSDYTTGLPLANITNKIVKRAINFNDKWAILYIDIENYVYYQEKYGAIASEKVLKTFVAIVQTILEPDDYFGHIKENHFILLTSPLKAEKLGKFLTFAFDKVAQRFYSETDINRGYLIVNGINKAGRRISFVNLKIGIITSLDKRYSYLDAINSVKQMCKLAKQKEGSYFVSEKPKISTEDLSFKDNSIKILIIENDAALAYLLTTTLELQGYVAFVETLTTDTVQIINQKKPDIIILDMSEDNFNHAIALCKIIKTNESLSHIKIITTPTVYDKEVILNCGADVYLPKPFELIALYKWINQLTY